MRSLIGSSVLIFLMLQLSLQFDDEILEIDLDYLDLNDGPDADGETDFSISNIEKFITPFYGVVSESTEKLNNQETEFTFSGEGEIESSTSIVANADDCVPVVVENYEEFQEETPEMMLEEMGGNEANFTVMFWNCQSIKRCSSVFIPRIGFNCMCKEEVSCIPSY